MCTVKNKAWSLIEDLTRPFNGSEAAAFQSAYVEGARPLQLHNVLAKNMTCRWLAPAVHLLPGMESSAPGGSEKAITPCTYLRRLVCKKVQAGVAVSGQEDSIKRFLAAIPHFNRRVSTWLSRFDTHDLCP